MQSNDLLTCVTCNVAFKEAELHRAHYKSDWHRYNLKRKVAELPAISAQDFAERVRIQNAQIESAQNQKPEEMFCKLCCKHFSTTNAFVNHKQSKKHKELEANMVASRQKAVQSEDKPEDVSSNEEKKVDDLLIAVKSDRAAKKAIQLEEMLKKQEAEMEVEEAELDSDDKEWEDIGEDEELDDFDETKIIPLTTCLFCDHKSETLEDKCVHMAKEHSFFIPDAEHVSDLEGLMKHLGMKLGVYHVCLWCSSKCYKDLLSVQKHMQDKGHNKMKFQGETLLEYVDYYTYEGDTTIDDEYDIVDSELSDYSLNTTKSNHDESGSSMNEDIYELVLPSGVKIGHRSLFKYYKQSFGHRNLEMKLYNNQTLKDKYKAIASGGTVAYNAEYQKQRKDIAYFKRWSAKMQNRLGENSNKINMKYYRRQNITF